MVYLPGGGVMLFLTDVDHVSFEKANETRQNNLQSATVSLQVAVSYTHLDVYKRQILHIADGIAVFCRKPSIAFDQSLSLIHI